MGRHPSSLSENHVWQVLGEWWGQSNSGESLMSKTYLPCDLD